MNSQYVVILFYKYIQLDNPEKIVSSQKLLCQKLNIKGKMWVAKEGVNGTLEGSKEDIASYIEFMKTTDEFADINFKKTPGTGNAFKKLQIRVRPEIVSTRFDDPEIGPTNSLTGKYLSIDELHIWISEGKKEFYIVDMRNDYETAVGHFAGSVLFQGFKNFRDLPKLLPQIESLKNKTVLTVCTGGIRCETASGLLLKYGFKDVYQLKDGILTYMQKYPNQDFLGKLYVFDGRAMVGFNVDSPDHQVVGKCEFCGKSSENLTDYYDENGVRRYEIVCPECVVEKHIKLQV